jgi:PKD repeat protein
MFLSLDPPGGSGAWPIAVNDYGQVLISSFPVGRSWLWTPTGPNGRDGQFVVLTSAYGDLIAADLNGRGDVSATGNGPESPFGGSTTHAFLWRPSAPNGNSGQVTDATPDVGFDYISGTSAGIISEESNGAVQIFGTFFDSFNSYDQVWTLSGFDAPQSLTANISSLGYANEGSELRFDARGTVPYSAGLQFLWEFGDGATATGSTAAHTYRDNGTYIVHLTATDADGHSSAASQTVVVANIAPTATFVAGPTTLNEGGSYVLTLSNVSDAAADMPTLRLALDCGDGRGFQSPSGAGSLTCSAPDEGARTARAQLVDKDGGTTQYTTAITILDVAPSITILSAPAAIDSQKDYAISFKFSDPGLPDRWSYSIDWGDGGITTVSSVATQGTTLTATHRFTVSKKGGVKSATYSVTISVRDNGGATGSAAVPVLVTATPGHP